MQVTFEGLVLAASILESKWKLHLRPWGSSSIEAKSSHSHKDSVMYDSIENRMQ